MQSVHNDTYEYTQKKQRRECLYTDNNYIGTKVYKRKNIVHKLNPIKTQNRQNQTTEPLTIR